MLPPHHIADLIEILQLRLYHLERKEALLGIMADPAILIERDQIVAKIERLQRSLAAPAAYALLRATPDAPALASAQPVAHTAAGLPPPAPARYHANGEDAMHKKLLLVDNDTDYLGTLADFLETMGHEVYRAESIERAQLLLEHLWVHVMIIDIRLRDDHDDRDESGLLLARQMAYASIPKIMLTRYPSIEAVRRALGHTLRGLPPAIDFIDKRDSNPQSLLDAIDGALTQHERLNFALRIAWDQPASFAALINLLLPLEHDTARLLERCAELEDLLRKLFYEYTQITIGRVLKHRPGQLALEVFAYNVAGVERQYVVSCGLKPELTAEDQRYQDLAPQVAGKFSTIRTYAAATLRFAASAYMLSGDADLEDIVPWRSFYQGRPPGLAAASIDQLYQGTLAAWWRRGRSQEQPTLATLLDTMCQLQPAQLSAEVLHAQIGAIGRQLIAAGLIREAAIESRRIRLSFANGSAVEITNPAAQIERLLSEPNFSMLYGVIHGWVDPDSILVDSHGNSWLIDFARAGRGPLIQDFVQLETTLKCELLDTLDLALRHALEQRLLATTGLAQPLADPAQPAELQRALGVIERIRQHAATLAGASAAAYQAGLLACALHYLASYQPALQHARRRLIPYAHALIQAGLLAEALEGSDGAERLPDPARTSLWLDEVNKVAWVEGRRVDLTAQEYVILSYLYRHVCRLVTRQELADAVLKTDYDDSEETRLNSAISRLRLKLEPAPKQPRYLITVHGHGYKLMLPDQPA